MPLAISFSNPRFWLRFYASQGCEFRSSVPNSQGFINFPCILPTHPKLPDTGLHGGINVHRGTYRCWNDQCRQSYQETFETSQVDLSPEEFLTLVTRLPLEEARGSLESFALGIREETPELLHVDSWSTRLPRPQPEWETALSQTQKLLSEDLPIVQEYLSSRSITFDVIHSVGFGYCPKGGIEGLIEVDEETLLIPYYQNGQLVGLRARSRSGKKSGVKESHSTLYLLDSIGSSTSRIVVVCEGETDTLATLSSLRQGGYDIPVVGTPGNFFRSEWCRHLQNFSRILLLPQTDRASRRLVEQIFAEPSLQGKIEVVELPFPPLSYGKDVADFVGLETRGRGDLVRLLGLPPVKTLSISRPRVLTTHHLFEKGQEAPQWVIPGLVEAEEKVMISGPPKSRKTYLALEMAESVSKGTPFLGVPAWTPTEPGRVLLFEEEGSLRDLGLRLGKLLQWEENPNLFVLHRERLRLDNHSQLARIRKDLLEIAPRLVILDPLILFHSQEENSATGMSIVMDSANTLLSILPGVAIVLVHHAGKRGEGARGSSAIWGSIDTEIRISKRPTGTIALTIEGRTFADDPGSAWVFAFDPGLGRHIPVEEPIRPVGGPLGKRIIQALKTYPNEWLTVEQLADATEVSQSYILSQLTELVKKGIVVTQGKGSRGSPKLFCYGGEESPKEESDDE